MDISSTECRRHLDTTLSRICIDLRRLLVHFHQTTEERAEESTVNDR